ncbi:putative dipeptidyl peptidase IV [Streptosporangium violaceochromogenes]|nr:putative dipeptidyl peptidase IV [Streptosporangium violaceochromogenes]
MSDALPQAAYAFAERMLDHKRAGLVPGERLTVTWIDATRCWYRSDAGGVHRYVAVDAEHRTRGEAFDHAGLAKSLEEAAGRAVDADRLPIDEVSLTPSTLTFDAFERAWSLDLETAALREITGDAPHRRSVRTSPDGRWQAFTHGHDLWVHDTATRRRRPLTRGGDEVAPFAEEPDAAGDRHLLDLLRLGPRPPRALWSPDSRRVLTHRIDQSAVGTGHLLDCAPDGGGRSRLRSYRYSLPGEPMPQGRWVVVDVTTGHTVEVEGPPFDAAYLSPVTWGEIWWDPSGEAVYWVRHARDRRSAELVEIDPRTGRARTVIKECGPTRVDVNRHFYDPPVVAVLRRRGEVLWFSRRDGGDRLYLHDLRTGECRGAVTGGDVRVRQILHTGDDAVHLVVSRVHGADPYARTLARLDLGERSLTVLVDDEQDHRLSASPDGRWFVDCRSTPATPPVWLLRDAGGHAVAELERADTRRLAEQGWSAPERVRVLAADGVTPVYGVLHRPGNFDPAQSYPVVDHIYPGPQVNRADPSFYGGFGDGESAAMAALGFVVVTLDGRGTPGRGKDFHDHSYGNLASAGELRDHVAAIGQLGETRPWMDLTRVGIVGHSAGGFAATKAVLRHPETFSVAVAEAGNHDNRIYNASWAEAFDGPVDPERYSATSNVDEVMELSARLLLVHGGMDDNVMPDHTLRLVDRLIAADQDFDMLVVPRAEHSFHGYQHYVLRKRWDYLVRHLLRREPPSGYRLDPVPLSSRLFEHLFDGGGGRAHA